MIEPKSTIRNPKWNLTHLNYLLVGVWALLGATATGLNWGVAQRLERQAQVAFYQARGRVTPPDEILILAIDEDSLNQGNLAAKAPDRYPDLAPIYRFPWQRQAYGQAIARLMEAGAKSVSLDILLTGESGYGRKDDQKLRQVLQRWGDRVVLASAHEFSGSNGGVRHYLVKPNSELVVGDFRPLEDKGEGEDKEEGEELLPNLLVSPQSSPSPPSSSSSRSETLHLGLINFVADPDGRIYRLSNDYSARVLRPLGLEAIPSFAEATLQAANSTGGFSQQPQGTTNNLSTKPAPQSKIQIIQNPKSKIQNRKDIFYYGRTGTFKQIPFWQVLDAKNWEFHRKSGTFKNKIVLVGATADSLQDFKRTPFAAQMPGIEVHANAIATLIEGRAISPAIPNNLLRGVLILLGVGAIATLLASRLQKPVWQFLSAVGLSVGWIGISYLSFTAAGLILPTAIPAIAIVLCGLSGLAIGAIREQLERIRLYHTLERYVAEPIVNEILDRHADDFRSLVKGRKVKAAILFSDIRSFTTFSLTRDPEQVVEQLNTYLEAMVEAILIEGGTLDKFIGDAVMAEFGSPISYGEKEDALRSIRAAIGMRKALVKLQQHWREQGKEILFNGIGIHYGEVIAGDIGSSKRREFAVIGDTVNVASRVEGLTGKLSVDILISESLYELVKDEVDVVDMGAHPLKGRGDNKIRLYSLVGFKGENHQLYIQMREALRRYLDFRKRTERASG